MDYYNPLHPMVPPNKYSPFSSLCPGEYFPPHYISSTRRRVPQPRYSPASKWRAATGRQPETQPITFDLKGMPGLGIPMREVCSRGGPALMSMMEGAGDPVFIHYPLRRIRLRILWPGYSHIEWERAIELHLPSGPITRSQIASQIATHYARFIEKTQYEAIDPQAGEWRVGIAGIPFSKLVLVSLWNVFDDSWQAEVALDFR